ncbi:MAG: hypothetical protein LBJ41_05380 [Treponema sp.]|nr:hypothetical protein [Treponema sp.]
MQCKLVFNTNNKFDSALVMYALTVLGIYLTCVCAPTLVTPLVSPIVG